jgi:hypothetical protein
MRALLLTAFRMQNRGSCPFWNTDGSIRQRRVMASLKPCLDTYRFSCARNHVCCKCLCTIS